MELGGCSVSAVVKDPFIIFVSLVHVEMLHILMYFKEIARIISKNMVMQVKCYLEHFCNPHVKVHRSHPTLH